jgi:hypothetical protein
MKVQRIAFLNKQVDSRRLKLQISQRLKTQSKSFGAFKFIGMSHLLFKQVAQAQKSLFLACRNNNLQQTRKLESNSKLQVRTPPTTVFEVKFCRTWSVLALLAGIFQLNLVRNG